MSIAASSTTSNPLVRVEHFGMSFGRTEVIQDLSFEIRRGETFGFLGSNGSGKTTTIRALLGIYQPTRGLLHIDGREFSPDNGDRLGYLPEERGLYQKESVVDVMMYFGRLKGLGHAASRKWSLDYLERVGIADKAAARIDKLSQGQQQKVQLGVTIMNGPELLILDEPTKGFDPVNRRLLMEIIEDQKRAGATVMMVTHQMEEVERLCDRILLLKGGKARAYGTVDEVRAEFGGTRIHIDTDGTVPTSDAYRIVATSPGRTELEVGNDVDTSTILSSLVSAGIAVRSFTPTLKSLDDIFIEIYGADATGVE
ncbi:ABC transporter ATP-binding protein [Demequina lutea]|uniref:ABC-2 type transport system ATP-binding protein n=1 Tax=Demequina lutea TaxID=431489 RepID=A0A7Z0CK81_9MICO|nr:ATP-binding cassette domain-containing protein [Demequina lutea]NYI41445.1 ABC-2 type transport system ATP-binding protein [Demequina lutea]